MIPSPPLWDWVTEEAGANMGNGVGLKSFPQGYSVI